MSEINDTIRKIIEEWIPDEDFVAAVQAEKLTANLQETTPELLDEWLHANAAAFITEEMTHLLRQTRARNFTRSESRAFGQAVTDNDDEVLAHFAATFVIDQHQTRRRLADMTGTDFEFVADTYERSGKRDLLFAEFYRQVGRKVQTRRLSEVLTEEQYDAMFQSIVRQSA